MRSVLLMLFVLISGCVLHQPQSFVYNEIHTSTVSNVTNTSTKTIKDTPAPKPAAVVIKTEVHKTNTTSCPRFELPAAGAIPVRPVFSDPELSAKTDLDVILAAHIKALSQHVVAERVRIEEAYQKWLLSCK